MAGAFEENFKSAVDTSKVLVVGAGGIGCELLKNLVLSGFKDIEIIDLDTIDVSNLNRQFLFQKQHVGKSKSKVARESALLFNPNVNIVAHHGSITEPEYGVTYFKKFNLVMNALDNRAARNHVNRMCLAADIPLIESGTAGYTGQVEIIKKGMSECYECVPKPPAKTYPGCTIRNTPSEPIHCIVWAKHLYNQLFGEEDPDEDVSPDTADPEAAGDAGEQALKEKSNNLGNVERVSTRVWAQQCDYDPEKLFQKFFHDDIVYLLSMDKLWRTRRPPTPLNWGNLPDAVPGSSTTETDSELEDQRHWSIAECAKIFADSCQTLKKSWKVLQAEGRHLVWDKDDRPSMMFVAACANIRSHIFGLQQKTCFDIKSMAGNIIPAIATTNAVIAGIIVLHAFKILLGNIKDCTTVYLSVKPNARNLLIVPEKSLIKPNENCIVCAEKPQVTLFVDRNKMTVKSFAEDVLKNHLHFVAPEATLGTKIILSCEEEDNEGIYDETLAQLGVKDGSILVCDDFDLNYKLEITVIQKEFPDDATEKFEAVADPEQLKQMQQKAEAATNGTSENGAQNDNADKDGDIRGDGDEDDDLMCVDDICEESEVAVKRKASDSEDDRRKRLKVDDAADDDVTIVN